MCHTKSSRQVLAKAKMQVQAGFSCVMTRGNQDPASTQSKWHTSLHLPGSAKAGGGDEAGPARLVLLGVGLLFCKVSSLELWLPVALLTAPGQQALVFSLEKQR